MKDKVKFNQPTKPFNNQRISLHTQINNHKKKTIKKNEGSMKKIGHKLIFYYPLNNFTFKENSDNIFGRYT